jgi:hypothetical protein
MSLHRRTAIGRRAGSTPAFSPFASITLGLVGPLALLLACGSRTGLPLPEEVDGDGGLPGFDVSVGPDVRPHDAGVDVLPPLDAKPLRDVSVDLCRDAGATLVYAVTENNHLLRFDPPAASFTTIGTLACADPNTPFSMAVDRKGIAYVLYAVYDGLTPGNIYRVSLATSACLPTGFAAPDGFLSFGMGFSADDQGTGETLYVASDNATGGELGAIDTTSYNLSPIGFFNPPILGAELSGTGDGRLFAFYTEGGPGDGGPVAIAQIDKATGKIIARNELTGVDQGNAWAFAFWGGDFYLFTAPGNGGSIVQRYRPTDGSITQVADYPERIVGAGVSTCAPER